MPDSDSNASRSTRGSTRKDLGNFDGMLHTGLASHFRAGGSRYSQTTYNPLNAFRPGHLAAWIPHVMRYWFHKKHSFLDYTTPGKGTGVHTIGDRATLSLVATGNRHGRSADSRRMRGTVWSGLHDPPRRCCTSWVTTSK